MRHRIMRHMPFTDDRDGFTGPPRRIVLARRDYRQTFNDMTELAADATRYLPSEVHQAVALVLNADNLGNPEEFLLTRADPAEWSPFASFAGTIANAAAIATTDGKVQVINAASRQVSVRESYGGSSWTQDAATRSVGTLLPNNERFADYEEIGNEGRSVVKFEIVDRPSVPNGRILCEIYFRSNAPGTPPDIHTPFVLHGGAYSMGSGTKQIVSVVTGIHPSESVPPPGGLVGPGMWILRVLTGSVGGPYRWIDASIA